MRPDDARRSPVQALAAGLDRARRGEPGALRSLHAALETDAGPWRELGDLAARVEVLRIELATGPAPAAAEALRLRLAGIKAELAGPSPSPIERLLAAHAAACWLQVAHGDAAVALAPGA